MQRVRYAYRVEKINDKYRIYFPDIDDCLTTVSNNSHILGTAGGILHDHLYYLLINKREIPNPKYEPRDKSLDRVVDVILD